MVYSLTFKIPCDYLLTSAPGKKKLRKSMNIHDFSTAEKINVKNSVKSEKTQEKLKKPQEFKLKTRRGASFGCKTLPQKR